MGKLGTTVASKEVRTRASHGSSGMSQSSDKEDDVTDEGEEEEEEEEEELSNNSLSGFMLNVTQENEVAIHSPVEIGRGIP